MVESQPNRVTSGGLNACASKRLEPGYENTQYGLYVQCSRRWCCVPDSDLCHILFSLRTLERIFGKQKLVWKLSLSIGIWEEALFAHLSSRQDLVLQISCSVSRSCDIKYLHLDMMVHAAGGRVDRDLFYPTRDTVYSAGKSKSTETIRRGRTSITGRRSGAIGVTSSTATFLAAKNLQTVIIMRLSYTPHSIDHLPLVLTLS
jgi:hypothetical protein